MTECSCHRPPPAGKLSEQRLKRSVNRLLRPLRGEFTRRRWEMTKMGIHKASLRLPGWAGRAGSGDQHEGMDGALRQRRINSGRRYGSGKLKHAATDQAD